MNRALFEFLRELQENNNREWFQANKKRYDALHATFVDHVRQLIDRIATFDPEIGGLDARSCVYRIYRDLRFSQDKTPYKTHFGAYMTGFGGRTSPYGGYYIHLEPGKPFLSGGVWCPAPAMLKQLRKDLFDNMDEFLQIYEDPKFRKVFGELEGDKLSRMPQGFPTEAAHGEILKYKSFVVSSVKTEAFFCADDWIDRTVAEFKLLQPFNPFLNYTIGEFFGKA